MIKVTETIEMKQTRPFFHGTHANLTPYTFFQKMLKYSNDFQRQNFLVLSLK